MNREKETELQYNYESKKQIRQIIKDFDKLSGLANKGCTTAMCIRSDIIQALNFEYPNSPYRQLTALQYKALYYHLIVGENQYEVAERLGVSQPNISKHINVALSKLYVLLIEPSKEIQDRRWDEISEAHAREVEGGSVYFEL